MKTLLSTIALLFITGLTFGQIEFGKIYSSPPVDDSGEFHYLIIYEDGLVLMNSSHPTDNDLAEIEKNLHRNNDGSAEFVVVKGQAKIKEGSKASFVIEKDGKKINCIAQGYGVMLELTLLSSNSSKQEMTFMRAESVNH